MLERSYGFEMMLTLESLEKIGIFKKSEARAPLLGAACRKGPPAIRACQRRRRSRRSGWGGGW